MKNREIVSVWVPVPDGQTPLHKCAIRGHSENFDLYLAQVNGNPDVRDDLGNTPLHYARALRMEYITQFLLDAGADPDAVNDLVLTPSDAASKGVLFFFQEEE